MLAAEQPFAAFKQAWDPGSFGGPHVVPEPSKMGALVQALAAHLATG